MDINSIWAVIEPYITGLAGTATGGIIVGIICRLLQGRLLRRVDSGDIADKVASRLAGKTLNIDVTAVTEKRLDKIDRKMSARVEEIAAETTAQRHLLALMGGAISKLKAVTGEERTALTEAIRAIERDYVPPEPETVTTVRLEPIQTAGENSAQKGGLSL